MKDRIRRPAFVIAVILALCAATAVVADGHRPRLDTPRTTVSEPGLHRLNPSTRVLPLGIGKPNSFAMLDTWITSDQMPDDYTTDLAWYNDENLSVFVAFYSFTDRTITASVQVKDESGATVFTDGFTEPAFEDSINFFVLPIGQYLNGAYKITVKIKQGSKSIGQAYWYPVFDPVS